MFHLNHPTEVIQQPDPRYTLSVSQWATGWVFHIDFGVLPRRGGFIRYSQSSGQSRECAVERGLEVARTQLVRHS